MATLNRPTGMIERAAARLERERARETAPREAWAAGSAAIDAPPLAEQPVPCTPRQHAIIDVHALQTAGVLVMHESRSALAEQFRHVKRPLVKAAREVDGSLDPASSLRLIAVTSALAQEGKTFFAVNLATSIAAEMDTSVLLIDADVVKPGVFARLGLERPAIGLLDLLADPQPDPDAAIVSTNVPHLELLDAGRGGAWTTERLASGAMQALLRRLLLRRHHQILILDAPPLVVTSEAQVLAAATGQVVLVVQAQATPRKAVAAALDMLDALSSHPRISLVLNQAHGGDDGAEGYGYGYDGYGGYAKPDQSGAHGSATSRNGPAR